MAKSLEMTKSLRIARSLGMAKPLVNDKVDADTTTLAGTSPSPCRFLQRGK